MFNYNFSFRNNWNFLRNGSISMEEFMEIMLNEGYCPCKKTWFNRRDWSIEEAVLIYHNWEPSMFENIEGQIKEQFRKFIDQEHDIFGLLESYIYTDNFPNQENLQVEKIIELLNEKNIEIPQHFPEHLVIDHEKIPTPLLNKNIALDDSYLKKLVKSFDLKKFSINELVILQARIIAATRWKQDSNLTQTEIVDDSDFRTHIVNFYNFSGSELDENKEMRTEWISNLDPRDTKAGRPKGST